MNAFFTGHRLRIYTLTSANLPSSQLLDRVDFFAFGEMVSFPRFASVGDELPLAMAAIRQSLAIIRKRLRRQVHAPSKLCARAAMRRAAWRSRVAFDSILSAAITLVSAAEPRSERPPQVFSINRRSPYTTVESARSALCSMNRDIRAFDPIRVAMRWTAMALTRAGAPLIDGRIQSIQRLSFMRNRRSRSRPFPLRAARRQ